MPRYTVHLGDVPAKVKKKITDSKPEPGKLVTSIAPQSLVMGDTQPINGLDAQMISTPKPGQTEPANEVIPQIIPFKQTKRRLKDGWLQAYLQYTSGQESPPKFHFFAGLSVLSGAIRRHVYLDRGYYVLYPNIYVVLVAGSAICRKSTACNIAVDLLRSLTTKHIFHGQASTQGLLDFMTTIKDHYCQGALVRDMSPFVYSDELYVLLSGQDYTKDIVKILTDFYGGKDTWDYKLKKSVVPIKNCSPTIFAASTPVWLGKAIPSELVAAGLTGRMFFVYEDRGKRIAHPKPPSDKLKAALQHDLLHIANLRGEFIWEDEAKDAFTTWYEALNMDYDQDVLAPYYARKPDHALKLAMLFAVNEADDLHISLRHWKRSLQVLEEIEKYARLAYQYMGTTEAALAGEVMSTLKSLHGVDTRANVFRRVGLKYKNVKQFNEVLESLILQKKIKKRQIKLNHKWVLIDETFEDTVLQAEKFAKFSKIPREIGQHDPDTKP